ncbi:MAG TPA: polysaccharide biosynthesis/export family protein [Candidatus Acidoferrales bacterium]|nr:polysaccharide biosynthesis/export family protein [Candidatus Acidoferrales bacterium]
MAKKTSIWLVASALACIVPVAAAQSGATQQAGQSNEPVPAVSGSSAEAPVKAATSDSKYLIGAGDVLKISVWDSPQLSEDVPVRPDGKISLPLLNDVQAAGLTPTQLSEQITEKLKQFVKGDDKSGDPHPVTVIVTQINSQRVYVLGEVTRAGAFPMLPGMNVLQALSSAGGFTQFANTKKIYVLRTESGAQHKFLFNYKDVVSGKQPGENITLKPGDTIVVP